MDSLLGLREVKLEEVGSSSGFRALPPCPWFTDVVRETGKSEEGLSPNCIALGESPFRESPALLSPILLSPILLSPVLLSPSLLRCVRLLR